MVIRNLNGQTAQTLTWDEGRRLEEVNQGNTTVAEFLYAIDDSRVRRVTDDGTATYYLLDGTEYTEGPNGNYFTYYHQINGDTVAFTRSDTGVTTWMGSDIVNSTAITHDENGTISTQRYTPFGEQRNAGNLDTDHLYTGQVHDESSGLAFYNARYYDPAIGRFITPDSIVPNPLDGQDYNRYTYVRNNPIKYSDPSGHCSVAPDGSMICGNVQFDSNGNRTSTNWTAEEANQESIRSQNPTFEYNGSAQPATTCFGSDCLNTYAQAVQLVGDVLSGEEPIVSIGVCGEGEGTSLGGHLQHQGCTFVELANNDLWASYGGGGGLGLGQSAGGTGGIVLASSSAPDLITAGGSVCVDASAGGGVGGGVAVCFGLTGSGVDLDTWAIEAFVGPVAGASANTSVQGSVAVNLPDYGPGALPDEQAALEALQQALR